MARESALLCTQPNMSGCFAQAPLDLIFPPRTIRIWSGGSPTEVCGSIISIARKWVIAQPTLFSIAETDWNSYAAIMNICTRGRYPLLSSLTLGHWLLLGQTARFPCGKFKLLQDQLSFNSRHPCLGMSSQLLSWQYQGLSALLLAPQVIIPSLFGTWIGKGS